MSHKGVLFLDEKRRVVEINAAAARLLGITFRSLRYRMARLGIE